MEDRELLGNCFSFRKKSFAFLAGIVLLGVFVRLLPHPPNFSPVGGLALFSGVNIGGFWSFLIPLTIMFFSDLILGFHSSIFYVYLSFVIIVLIGKSLKKVSLPVLFLSSLCSSFLFFLITNFGVWLTSGMYIKNIYGLLNSYLMGLPFFKNTLIGDLFYTFSFFYGYRLSLVFFNKLRPLLSKK